MGLSPQSAQRAYKYHKFCGICKHVEQIVLCLRFGGAENARQENDGQ